MRSSLATSFNWIQIVNLHGSVKAGGLSPSGEKDENVFDIQQGVAISILCRCVNETTSPTRRYADLWGGRSFKEETLRSQPGRLQFRPFLPVPEHYLFVPTTSTNTQEYLEWKSLDQIFNQFGTGIMTNRNGLTIAPSKDELLQIISSFTNPALSDSAVSQQLGVKSNALWDLSSARKQLRQLDAQEFFRPVDFRPFDKQVVFYHEVAVDNLRRSVMNIILRSGNRALVVSRQQFTPGFRHVFVTRRMFDECFISTASREKASGFPMFALPESSDDLRFGSEQHNIRKSFLPVLRDFPDNERLSLQFHYIYAVLHSSNYRARYEEHLKRGYARIPETEDRDFGTCLAGLGNELVAVHLLESLKLDKPRTEFIGDRKQVERVSYSKNTVWIDKAKTAGFPGVPTDVWNFRIGGYQVCEKWLKDRKGRALSRDDIGHYHKIVIALAETIRLICEIDNVIEKHGGWPSAFQRGKK